jgi:hypothetical protein
MGQKFFENVVDAIPVIANVIVRAAGPAVQNRGGSGSAQFQPAAASPAPAIDRVGFHIRAVQWIRNSVLIYLLETQGACQMSIPGPPIDIKRRFCNFL